MITKSCTIVFTAFALLQSAVADDWHFDGADRIVALSDIHGAYSALVPTLQVASIIDDSLSWSGGASHLVIVGDILDRGPDSRLAMDLLMRLEAEAESAGGKVHVLIGNHEAMNIIGDLRYVSKAEYAAFADDEIATDREHWFEVFQSRRANDVTDVATLRADFDGKFPVGFFAHRRAFAPDGKYGRWLLQKPIIVVVNGTAFVHGGLSPTIAEIGLRGVNRDLQSDIALYARELQVLFDSELLLPTDAENDHVALVSRISPVRAMQPEIARASSDISRLNATIMASDGPLWYRGHTYCSEIVEGDRLMASLQKIEAQRVVIGHTPTSGRRVLERLGGRIIEIDTGMLSSHYKGSGNALIIEGDRLFVVNQASAEEIPPLPQPRQVGSRPGVALSTEDIELLLSSGQITIRNEDAAGHLFVTVSDGRHSINASFVKRARRGIYPEVAAYRLDRLINMEAVPVTVARKVDGTDGSLQFLPVEWIDEVQRQEQKTGGSAYCPLPDQWDAMLIFDILLGNELRTAQAIRYDLDTWKLMLTDHQRAFSTSGKKPARYKDARITVGPTWKAALAKLDDDVLQADFAALLDKRRIKALGQRRDLLLSQ